MENLNRQRRLDNLFPTPVCLTSVTPDVCALAKDQVLKIIQTTPALSDMLQETGGATTPDDLNQRPEFFELTKEIQQEMNVYAEVYLGLAPNSIQLTCMWANVHTSGYRHQTHQHPNSYLSGVVYLNVPDTSNRGNIYFMDPRQAKNMQHGDFVGESGLSSRYWEYVPTTSLMILFPSWLEHGTQLFKSDEYRVSLSFNFSLIKATHHSFKLN